MDKSLPNERALEAEIQKAIVTIFTDIWRELGSRFQVFAAHISQQVEQSLQQARLASGGPGGVRFVLPQVPTLKIPQDSFEEAWQGLFAGGLLAAVIGGPGAWVLAVGGWLAGLAMGRDRQRKRQVKRIVEQVGNAMDHVMASVVAQIQEKIRLFAGSLDRHIRDRISVFVHDVEGQLEHLGEPLSPSEHARFGEIEQTVRDTLSTLALVCKEIELPLDPQTSSDVMNTSSAPSTR